MAHRNKGNGKMPGKHAPPRTWRRWRIRKRGTIMITGSHTHIDPNVKTVDNSG